MFAVCDTQTHEYGDLDRLALVNILHLPDRLNLDLSEPSSRCRGITPCSPWNCTGWFRHRFEFVPRYLCDVVRIPELHGVGPTQLREPAAALPGEFRLVLSLTHRLADELFHSRPGFGFLAKAVFVEAVGCLHATVGMPPIAYLIQVRVNRAAVLLRTTPWTITGYDANPAGDTDSNLRKGFDIGWPTQEAGLIGPVTPVPVRSAARSAVRSL